MKKISKYICGIFMVSFGAMQVFGSTVSLSDWAFRVNSSDYNATTIGPVPPGSLPGIIDVSAFNLNSDGLGSLTISFTAGGTGSFTINTMLDYDLNAAFFNEYGSTSGALAAGESFTIGDYATLPAGLVGNETLDNVNHVPGTTDNSGSTCVGPTCNTDVFTGLGYTVNATAGQLISFTLTSSLQAPGSGFYLHQLNPNVAGGNNTTDLYESATVSVTGGGGQTPEPGTWLLVSGALVAALGFVAKRKA